MTTSPEIENGDGKSLTTSENMEHDTSTIDEKNEGAVQIQTDETNNGDVNTTIEIKNIIQQIGNEIKNTFGNNLKENVSEDSIVVLSNETINEDSELSNNGKTYDDSKPIKGHGTDALDLTVENENDAVEQFIEKKNNDQVNVVNESEIVQVNTTGENKILEDAVENSIQLKDPGIEQHLQLNGETLSLNYENTEHELSGTTKDRIATNDDGIETKKVEVQNSLNTLLSKDVKVNEDVLEKENNITTQLINNADFNDDVNNKINGNIVNQDSISNSSDSETIINSELHEINGVDVENNEQKAVAQPISVITIQTCDIVDSDCSEAYLTPNELNDTPKKVSEKINLNINDHVVVANDDVSQLNPPLEPNNENEIPSKNSSEVIILEQKTIDNKVEISDDKLEVIDNNNDRVNESEENVEKTVDAVKNIENNVNDDVRENEMVKTSVETRINISEDIDVVLQPYEHSQSNDKEGMCYL